MNFTKITGGQWISFEDFYSLANKLLAGNLNQFSQRLPKNNDTLQSTFTPIYTPSTPDKLCQILFSLLNNY